MGVVAAAQAGSRRLCYGLWLFEVEIWEEVVKDGGSGR